MDKTILNKYLDKKEIRLSGMPDGLDIISIGDTLTRNPDYKIVYVLKTNNEVNEAANIFSNLFPNLSFLKFPVWDCSPYDLSSPDPIVSSERINTITELSKRNNKNRLILISSNAILSKNVTSESLVKNVYKIKKNSVLNYEYLKKGLVRSGYRKSETVIEVGEFSTRGSIVDIYTPQYKMPIRIDFFDDIVDSIKLFDPISQISTKSINSIFVLPVSELIYSQEAKEKFKKKYREVFGINSVKDNIYQSVKSDIRYPGIEHWIPFFYKKLVTIFDIVSHDYKIILPNNFEENCNLRMNEIIESYNSRYLTYKNTKSKSINLYRPVPVEDFYITSNKIFANFKRYKLIYFSKLQLSKTYTNFGGKIIPGIINAANFNKEGINANLKKFIKTKLHLRKKIIISCKSEGSRSRIINMLEKIGVYNYESASSWDSILLKDFETITLIIFNINEGFSINNLEVLSEKNIFGKNLLSFKRNKNRKILDLKEIENFNIGDRLIHSEYGLGSYLGLNVLSVNGLKSDYLTLSYLDGDKVFVPVQNINLLTKYGGNSSLVTLDKLGAKSWSIKKRKAKEKIRDLAESLIRVASERKLKTSIRLKIFEEEYEKFTIKFPYTETEDQLNTMNEVIEDIRKDKPMDRLICGDVGFGKTEIAMRAAFIAVKCKTQVAVIAPTTVLARQHFETFTNRFNEENVSIKHLSRLTKFSEKKSIIKEIKNGKTNIIIGTHALLSDDIKFLNLSLFIIDEEQRFGVVQKEKLKNLTTNVHVLTLTATPIPRTLQMAIAGIRDLSVIATPPLDRIPIRSFIIPYDEYIIAEAIKREINRGGQVYCIVPRISDIAPFKNKIIKIIKNISLDIVHGKMKSNDIEKSMLNLYIGKTQLLIATSIIENGLDIQKANTIIVFKAEMFGLAQLYQFRGRVGRSNKKAYAYFLVNNINLINETTQRKLQILESLEGLGAGFSLASHDLDIRGAGNLLGDEQSGQIKEIGVGLYQKLLSEAVIDFGKDKKLNAEWSPIINIQVTALIPESYIEDLSLRLKLYRRISRIESDIEFESLSAEFIDRFGQMPNEVENLLCIMKIKRNCIKSSILKIDSSSKGLLLEFKNDGLINPDKILNWIKKSTDKIKITKEQKVFIYKEWSSVIERLETIESISKSLVQVVD